MRVLVAMSGGVDSSVAAALLQRQGFDVVGITLRLYDCEQGQSARSCCGLAGVAEARAAAGRLDIPHYVVDGQELFERRVLRDAWETYAAGQTPNPCVRCNEWMKFGLLYEQARELDAAYVATGHHARIVRGDGPGEVRLLRGRDPHKDQTYFLFSLTPQQLAISLLPIGELTKSEVREIARDRGLINADRLESQDACIAQQGELAEALRRRFDGRARPGLIRDTQGRTLGHHDGVHRFTIGQRKGLGVALGSRAYVVAIDPRSGDVVVGKEGQLAARGLRARDVSWLVDLAAADSLQAEVQIRYRHRAVPARLCAAGRRQAGQGLPEPKAGERAVEPDEVEVWFDRPQRAVTPGQAVVFYLGDRVLGGGWIAEAVP